MSSQVDWLCISTVHEPPLSLTAVAFSSAWSTTRSSSFCLAHTQVCDRGFTPSDMDPLSATASIIAILQLSGKVLSYLNDVKDASKDRARCAIEASNLHSLLVNLRFRLEEGGASQPWYTAVRALALENGPLDQFKQALVTLQTKMTDGGRLKKAGEALRWKFKKEEIDGVLVRIERLKTLVEIALQMDHL
jgi:hypothetical protein